MLDNVFFFLKTKDQVQYLHGMMSIQQALDALQACHFTAMPVIDQEGKYIGTLSEGDCLWYILKHPEDKQSPIHKLLRPEFMKACTINEPIDVLFKLSLAQNFVPIVDDRHIFIGIVTRQKILSFLMEQIKDAQIIIQNKEN